MTEALTQVTQENRQREQLAKEEQVYEIYREQEEIQVGEQLYLEQAERVAAVCTPAWQQKRQAEEQLARQELRRQEKREQKERLEAQLPGLREARDQSRREEPKRQSIRDELTRRQAELPGRRTACVTLKKLQKEQTEAARNCRDSQNQYERLETEYRSKAAALESLQPAFYRQQAGILASQPEIGRPCPVCGSLEHPAPAVISGEAVEEERVHTAQREKDEALKRLQSLGLLLKEQQTLAGQLADRVKEAEAKREGRDEERLAEEEAAIRQTEVQLKQQEQQARENLHACEECEKQVLPLAGELENQDKQVQDAREMWEKSEQNWKQSLAALHLSDEAEYQKYVLTQTERARRRQACQEYRERGLTPEARLQKLREMLEEAEQLRKEQQYARLIEMRPDAQESEQENARIHADEGGADRMGVMTDQEKGNRAETANPAQLTSYQPETALKSRSAELTLRRRQLDREYSALSQRVASNERIAAQLKNQFAKRKQQMAEWEWYADLSRTAGGELKGQERLALEQYVQAFYFEQIVDRANRRFHEMSGGRYQLGRRQEASSRRSMAGLELEVMDYYTGKMRPVSSLSGGEAFQASLSLALGLSDVVQSMAGGIRIEAMFVDEGFGSLDRESMDLAISTLKGLSEEHFLVGIISHVEELKDRIERKIIVEKSPEGSHVRLSL